MVAFVPTLLLLVTYEHAVNWNSMNVWCCENFFLVVAVLIIMV